MILDFTRKILNNKSRHPLFYCLEQLYPEQKLMKSYFNDFILIDNKKIMLSVEASNFLDGIDLGLKMSPCKLVIDESV